MSLVFSGFVRRAPRALIVYALGIVTLGIDLCVPLDVDTPVFYSVGIIACGWLRSRRHLWLATVLFIGFAFSDMAIGAPPVLAESPRWVFVANRTFLACALLLLALIVDVWIRSVAAIEQQQQRLTHQNEELHNARSTLEERVRERTRELETASHERQEALAALYQAQKMEAVGQLTGGVAHDINNLLTVIGGNASILIKNASNDARIRRIETIIQAVDHGARLTRQLLAFARRQTLHSETLDLYEAIHKIGDMMKGSLRENIQIQFSLADDLWLVETDPAQLELALINIGINARDAMPEGGVLRIDAHNVTFAPTEDRLNGLVGQFVALMLSDTGSGIAPDVLDRVFEPFFTTKPVGKGSGLGLSQVYGFAKQSGGAVTVRSEIGEGTAITLYLPRAFGAVQSLSGAHPRPLRAGAGRILYVEDNPEVAAITKEMLTDTGFEVHNAGCAAAALKLVAEGEAFDLLLTDILMPGNMNGNELAREIRRLAPNLPVLLTSGYTEEWGKAEHKGFVILRKPYTSRALSDALARCLEARQRDRV